MDNAFGPQRSEKGDFLNLFFSKRDVDKKIYALKIHQI